LNLARQKAKKPSEDATLAVKSLWLLENRFGV